MVSLIALGGLAGCAMNFAEMRPARTLEGGEVQLVYGNTVVAPTAAARQMIESATALADELEDDAEVSEDEALRLAGGAAAIALSAPGYGAYVEGAVGLGYGIDASARLGSGVRGLGLRKGLDRDPWHVNVNGRVSRTNGASWSGALDLVNDFAEVSELQRTDWSGGAQGGLEIGELGSLWCGVRGGLANYDLWVDARGLGRDAAAGQLRSVGGYAGGALGFRYVHAAAELVVLRTQGDLLLFEERYDLSGWVIAPSWGFWLTF